MRLRSIVIGVALAGSLACGISQQQEIQMGQEYAQQINAQLPIVQDPELNRYINVLGDSIARLTSRGDLDWHFFIVDAQEVNAFAVPGGALFARFSRQDEAEADQEGVKNTVRAGISPVGMVTMFQKLLEERKSRPGAVESWFLTHPLEEDRITAVQALINQVPPSRVAQLGTDTRNFHS